MKKIIVILCLLSFGLSCNALELFPYQGMSNVQTINGTVTTNGCNDIITIPSSQSFNILKELTSSVSGAIMPSVSLAIESNALPADPYVVPVDGVNYVMVKDKKTTDWNERDLLGYDDPKDNMFLSLRSLESDGDFSKITGKELKTAGIRLVRLNEDGVLLVNDRKQDYSLDKINYIDMSNLKKTANSKNTGIFGHFNVYLKTDNSAKKMVIGYVTFDTHSNLKILFK